MVDLCHNQQQHRQVRAIDDVMSCMYVIRGAGIIRRVFLFKQRVKYILGTQTPLLIFLPRWFDRANWGATHIRDVLRVAACNLLGWTQNKKTIGAHHHVSINIYCWLVYKSGLCQAKAFRPGAGRSGCCPTAAVVVGCIVGDLPYRLQLRWRSNTLRVLRS